MKLIDYIRMWWRGRRNDILYTKNDLGILGGYCSEEPMPFARAIFLNICEILTDINNEVIWTRRYGDLITFSAFKAFAETWGEIAMLNLFKNGFVVIGYKDNLFRILNTNEYYTTSDVDATRIKPFDNSVKVYVMRSSTFVLTGMSDEQLLKPFLKYLDNVLNSSNTVSARLGSMVIMSPQNPPSSPTTTVLSEQQRKELEKSFGDEYGSLARQKQMMLLTRPVNTQVINLAGLDQRTAEKVKLAILAICDRIKVPANQVAIIDASSSRSLANGTELREGDLAKYRSFRRLLNSTLWQMASDFGLTVDYVIENEPKTTQGDTIEQ